MNHKKFVLTVAFAQLWVADTVLTLAFTNTHGIEAEANPFVRMLLEQHPLLFVAVKAFTLVFWLVVSKRAATELHVILCAIMLLVVSMGLLMVNQ